MRKTKKIQLPGSNSHKGYFTNKDVRNIQASYNKHIEIFSEMSLADLEILEESKVYKGSSLKALNDIILFKQKSKENEKEQSPTE